MTRWKQLGDPLLNILQLDVESWRDDTTLVQSTVKLNDNLAGSVVVNFFEFTDVTYFTLVPGHSRMSTIFEEPQALSLRGLRCIEKYDSHPLY